MRPWRRMGAENDPDDAALVARSQRGDVAAFNCLVERYQESAYGLALRMLGEPETAADVTQDAFLSAFRHIGTFRGASFRPWLLRIVSNACYDYWRARARRQTTSLDALVDAEPEDEGTGGHVPAAMMDEQWDPERTALRSELVALIQAALLEIPMEQRLALVLSDIQGMSYEEIADVMQTSLGTVKSRISRARGRMRDVLRAHGELLPHTYRRAKENG